MTAWYSCNIVWQDMQCDRNLYQCQKKKKSDNDQKKINSKKRENNPASISVVIDPSEISPGLQNSSKNCSLQSNRALYFIIIKKYSDCFQVCEPTEQFIYFVDYVTVRILLGIKVFEGWKAFGRFLMKFTVYLWFLFCGNMLMLMASSTAEKNLVQF